MEWQPDIPRWKQVFDALEERIDSGAYPPGERLPSLMAIQQEFGIAVATAQRVLRELRTAGLAYMEPGIGTFVTKLPQRPES